MTGTQQLIGWICLLLSFLAGWFIYVYATYGFDRNRENQ